jgi:membrane protein involved in colicin uptake
MEQTTMEQIMEFLKADKAESEAERKADRAEMRAHHEKMMAGLKRMNAKMDAWLGKMEACREVTRLFGGREGTNSKRDRGGGRSAGSPQGSNRGPNWRAASGREAPQTVEEMGPGRW